MRNKKLLYFLLVSVLIIPLSTSSAPDSGPAGLPGGIIVKFKNPNQQTGISNILNRFGIDKAEQLFTKSRGSGKFAGTYLFQSIYLSEHPEYIDDALESLNNHPAVDYAEPNAAVTIQMTPDDPYYSSSGAWSQSFGDLWGLHKINAGTAWDSTLGAGVIVGISDTGIDYNHPEINANIWNNPGETGNDAGGNDKRTNGQDDDGNGYTDDWRGWNFVENNNNPFDGHGHGTHVAGTVSATGNNSTGIIGVAPQAKVMALRGLNNAGAGFTDDLAESIIYAADNGAGVINMSWGGTGPAPQALIDAINYAHDIKDTILVAAAGNNNADVGTETSGFFPASIRDVVTVAASDHTDTKASFSNTGAKLDVSAPGGGNTIPAGIFDPHRTILSLLSSGAGPAMTGSGQLIIGGSYVRQAGTSMASPHVAGVAALVRALHPSWPAETVRQSLRTGSDDIGTAGFDVTAGYGRLNAAGATGLAEPLEAHINSPYGTISDETAVNIIGSAGGTGFVSRRLEYGSGNFPVVWTVINTSSLSATNSLLGSWNISAVPDGIYTLKLTATDSLGRNFEDRVVVNLDRVIMTSPSPVIISVFKSGQVITISGVVTPAQFLNYTIQVRKSDNTFLAGPAIVLTNGGTQKVSGGTLATWNTAGVTSDHYTLILNVNLSGGGIISESSKVIVDPDIHIGWPMNLGASPQGFALTNHLNTADLNGDGQEEILIAYGSSVRVFRHDGTQLAGWPQTIDPSVTGAFIQKSPSIADINGGSPEILAANNQGYVFIWNASGTLLPGWPKYLGASTVSVNDVNSDGIQDIAVIGTNGTLNIVDINGVSLSGWPQTVDPSSGTRILGKPAFGDSDGDGKNEIAVVNMVAPNRLYLFNHDGTVVTGWPNTINPAWVPGLMAEVNPAMGDLNGDGKPEIVIGGDGFVYAFTSNGSNLSGWPVATKPALANSPAIGDIDGDGQPEVVAGNDRVIESGASKNYLYAWRGNGAVLPGWPVAYDKLLLHTFFGFGATALADIDGDGKADIIVSSDAHSVQPFALNAYNYLGSKINGFPKPTLNIGGHSTNTAAVANLDADSSLELAWVDQDFNLNVWDLPAPASAVRPWPMFHHDAAHTGLLPPAATPPPSGDTIRPVVTLTVPSNNALLSGTKTIKATASDNTGVTVVKFYLDGSNLLGSDTTSGPYSISWNTTGTTDGPHTLTAKSYDAAGNESLPSTITVTVDNSPPSVSVTSPLNNSTVPKNSVVTITAGASDNTSGIKNVIFFVNGTKKCTDTVSPYTCAWTVPSTAGVTYKIKAKATNNAGKATTSSVINVVAN